MAKEVEITFKYTDGEEATIVAKASSLPAPRIFPPVFYYAFSSYSEKSGSFKTGTVHIECGTFKLLEGTDDEGESEFEIVESNCQFQKFEDENIYRLHIMTKSPGTRLPFI